MRNGTLKISVISPPEKAEVDEAMMIKQLEKELENVQTVIALQDQKISSLTIHMLESRIREMEKEIDEGKRAENNGEKGEKKHDDTESAIIEEIKMIKELFSDEDCAKDVECIHNKATFIFEIEYAKQGYRAVYIRKDFEQLFAGLCIMSSFRSQPYSVEYKMKLLSHNDNKPKFEKTLIRVFTAYSKANEVQLISFKELVDALKGYVEHDSIYIDFKVYPSVRCLPIPVQ
ncbi:hypothetical protein PRIPAC_83413, partial [Pristionchus pacificus]|uniref:Uncharacterized protein n=1 Tax=Pristionchus pacificus TaxID=54126 RepID=A0A2A6BLV4_PRIPA